MNNTSRLQNLVQLEPWRQGIGLPMNALDPTWEPGPSNIPCDGEVDWEPGTRWWVCQDCGYIGSAYTQLHPRVANPIVFLAEAIQFFKERHPELEAQQQLERMAFIAGAALRYAAVHPDLGAFIDSLRVK